MHTNTYLPVPGRTAPEASKSRTLSQDGTKGKRRVFSLHLLRSSTWRVPVLASLISNQLKTPTKAILQRFQEGDSERQKVNISCLQRFSAHEELEPRWNTVWWLNQGGRNQLDETPGIKGTESTLSLLSLGSHPSERIGDRFGPRKKQRVNLWFCDSLCAYRLDNM